MKSESECINPFKSDATNLPRSSENRAQDTPRNGNTHSFKGSSPLIKVRKKCRAIRLCGDLSTFNNYH